MAQILKWKSLNKKEIKEDGDRIKEDRAFTQNCLFSSSFFVFFYFLFYDFLSFRDVLVYFLRV